MNSSQETWKCVSCEFEVTDHSDKKVLGVMLGPLKINICPNCLNIYLDRDFYDNLMEAKESKIITPNPNPFKGISSR